MTRRAAPKTLIIILLLASVFFPSDMVWGKDVRFPRPAGFVNDFAHILSQSAVEEISRVLLTVEAKTAVEISIVTLDSIKPDPIEQYAVELFKDWGIGKKGADNGLLLLIAVKDREVRIEVGYGLEGAVTDLKSAVIIRDILIPAFKNGDYSDGVRNAVLSIVKLIEAEYNVDITSLELTGTDYTEKEPGKEVLGRVLTLLFFIMIFGFRFGTLFFFTGPGARRGYWSGGSHGSFGGGFGGFGGGFSGGGGASGRW